MTKIDWDRTKKYTAAEFKAIERNADGDICYDLDVHILWMTEAQRNQLTGDDQYRADLADEEMAYMHENAAIEFGVA
jgi:hypothetical protein